MLERLVGYAALDWQDQMNRLCRSLVFAIWMAISSTCQAVTFNFEVLSGDTDVVDFEATIVLSNFINTGVTAQTFGGIEPEIVASPGFEALIFEYAFSDGDQFVFLTPTLFDRRLLLLEGVSLSVRLNSLNSFSHNTSGELPDFGFNGTAITFFDVWEFRFSSDPLAPDFFQIKGRFVQVPEPTSLGLIVLGLLALGHGISKREISQRF